MDAPQILERYETAWPDYWPTHDNARLLPADGGLPAYGPRSVTARWYGTDNPDVYAKQNGHPVYGADDIVYRINSLGYRAEEFDKPADLRVLSVGCSNTFGVGVREEERYSSVFARLLADRSGRSVADLNMAFCGASADYVARIVHTAAPILKPDVVLVLWPSMERREIWTRAGEKIDYLYTFAGWEADTRAVADSMRALTSANNDALSFFRNYRSVRGALSDRVFLSAFLMYAGECELPAADRRQRHIQAHLDPACQVAETVPRLDTGRDHLHPGPLTHRRIAELFWDKLVETGRLASLLEPKPAAAGAAG